MSPVEQAVGPHAFFWLQLAGYLVFAAAWIVVTLAIMRALLDLVTFLSEPERRPPSPCSAVGPAGSRIAPVSDYGRVDRLSSAPAVSARVLAFPARKTRNRLVVR